MAIIVLILVFLIIAGLISAFINGNWGKDGGYVVESLIVATSSAILLGIIGLYTRG